MVKDDKGNDDSYFHNLGHDEQEQRVLKKLTLKSSLESLIKLVDKDIEINKNIYEENKDRPMKQFVFIIFKKNFGICFLRHLDLLKLYI